ncbi:MAG: 1-acyl-sn-glycerol-3-phosphate acyltransferase [Alphaproteobacteria bacterium]
MFSTVAVPVWLLVLVGVFAAWAALDRLLIPSVRWFLRSRVNKVLDQIGSRLQVEIPSITLTRRQVLIDRLMYDAQVQKAAEQYAAENKMPREVAMEQVGRYAREIIPAFNAYFYFRIGYWLARKVTRLLYRVRLGYMDEAGLRAIGSKSTPVFIINHRSNMDYVVVAFMVGERAAISYAVGEWARTWPLSALIRAVGGFFVRRNSNNPLYRKVLERYVNMATSGGVPQAIFPEGGLSRDGRLREPKIGLIDYMMRGFDPADERDVVFIPVGLNYDRVLEDRTLLLKLDPDATKRGKFYALGKACGFFFKQIWLMVRRRWYRFGYACVNFGTPISMRAYMNERGFVIGKLPPERRIEEVQKLTTFLMGKITDVVPVLPVALIATVFRQRQSLMLTELEVKAGAQSIMAELERRGARIYIPREDRDYAIGVGLRMLKLRHLINEEDGFLSVDEKNMPVLSYYANSIEHLVPSATKA